LIVHAGVLANHDPDSSWERFLTALESDLSDIQGGTTPEGIHVAAMSGTLDVVQRIYLGLEIRDGTLHFTPRLTDRLDGLSFPTKFRDTPIRVTIEGGDLTVTALAEGGSPPIRVGVAGQITELGPGESATFIMR
jgi:trehalose/maltose hydrolase-like predicted phosphorylase